VFRKKETRAEPIWYDVPDWARGQPTASGKRVDEDVAFKYSVFWSGVTLIADAVASLTPEAFVESEDGKIDVRPLPQWIRKPHPELRPSLVRNQLQTSVLCHGNGYAQLLRRSSDDVIIGMVPLDTKTVHCEWVPKMEGVSRRYQINAGPWLGPREIFHLQGPTKPGKPTGMSVINAASESISLGLTLEEFGARYFSQGSFSKTVLVLPGKILDDNQVKQTIRNYERAHRGPTNWHRPSVLSGPQGTDLKTISIPPEDAQFLESREFQALDVARWLRVPPHKVGVISKETSWGSGLAEQNTSLVQSTYAPWIQRWEETYTAYSPGGDGLGLFIRLNKSELLRGTFAEAAETWTNLVKEGVATPNEARKNLGLPRIEGGDKLREGQTLNGKVPAKKPTPTGKDGAK